MDETVFLAALRAAPDDDTTRLVYADWLDEQEDARAAFIRLERKLVALPDEDERRTELKERLQKLARGLDVEWLRLVSRPVIELCEVAFAFECPRQWEKLTPTHDPAVRHCTGCRKSVYYCETIGEARAHADLGHCVAVDLRLRRRPGDLETERFMTLGVLALPEPPPRPDDEPDQPGRRRR